MAYDGAEEEAKEGGGDGEGEKEGEGTSRRSEGGSSSSERHQVVHHAGSRFGNDGQKLAAWQTKEVKLRLQPSTASVATLACPTP